MRYGGTVERNCNLSSAILVQDLQEFLVRVFTSYGQDVVVVHKDFAEN